jgi:hypothetical protein
MLTERLYGVSLVCLYMGSTWCVCRACSGSNPDNELLPAAGRGRFPAALWNVAGQDALQPAHQHLSKGAAARVSRVGGSAADIAHRWATVAGAVPSAALCANAVLLQPI